MILDSKKFENYHCDQYISSYEPHDGIETMSLAQIERAVKRMKDTALLNNLDPAKVPVFIESNNKKYCIDGSSDGFGKCGMVCCIHTEFEGQYNQRLYYVAPDSRPEEGEYWNSRGIGCTDKGPDCSGFVVSKLAGERLLRMVKLVLETDEPESWLDYREYEPNWIQFKFQGSEFDLEKLNELSKEAGNIITLDILKKCKK